MDRSEILTIIIFYHYSGYKCFQYYYQQQVQSDLLTYFPRQVSYAVPYRIFAKWQTAGSAYQHLSCVCDNRRIHNHRVFLRFYRLVLWAESGYE